MRDLKLITAASDLDVFLKRLTTKHNLSDNELLLVISSVQTAMFGYLVNREREVKPVSTD